MLDKAAVTALRIKRQRISAPANIESYDELFESMSPVPTVYWCEPGQPPSLPLHADFDDLSYNSRRRANREILKGRFAGGNIFYVSRADLELYACLYKKEISSFTHIQSELLNLLKQEGPVNIGLMKEMTGYLVKNIAPALHRLQEAFLVFEDQIYNDWDRGWYIFENEFQDVNLKRYTQIEAFKLALPRFAFLCVFFTANMAKSFYRLPIKAVRQALEELEASQTIVPATIDGQNGYVLSGDMVNIIEYEPIGASVLLLHRNDFYVRAFSDELKDKFQSPYDPLYYIMLDGEIRGCVVGKFKFGPHIIEDILLDLSENEKLSRKGEILKAVYTVFSEQSPVLRYDARAL